MCIKFLNRSKTNMLILNERSWSQMHLTVLMQQWLNILHLHTHLSGWTRPSGVSGLGSYFWHNFGLIWRYLKHSLYLEVNNHTESDWTLLSLFITTCVSSLIKYFFRSTAEHEVWKNMVCKLITFELLVEASFFAISGNSEYYAVVNIFAFLYIVVAGCLMDGYNFETSTIKADCRRIVTTGRDEAESWGRGWTLSTGSGVEQTTGSGVEQRAVKGRLAGTPHSKCERLLI